MIKKLLASAALVAALATGHAHAEIDQNSAGLAVALITVTLGECIAPTINPRKEDDFNYFADAVTLLGEMSRYVSKDAEEKQTKVALEMFKQSGKETFCQRGKQGLDVMIATARKDNLAALIAGRQAWAKRN